jgi:diguanylate cyclase (GGDEF)-like protein
MLTRKFRKLALLNKIALITLLFFLSLNVLFFIFVSTIGNQPYLSKIGMLLYIGIAIVNGLQKLMKGFFKERESELLHKIAYTDNLTKLGNRYALERDTKQLPLESISIISLDLNYLKYTNDTFGHFGGDVLLKAAAECISSVYDKVYRVGGDEFIALLNDTDTQTLDSLSEKLRENVAVFNRERTSFKEFADSENFVLSIAAGYATYQAQDITYEQIMNRADEQMYQTKKEFHAKYGTIPETAVPRRQ